MATESIRAAMNTFHRVRCSVPSSLEEELPILLASLSVLGTEIGERHNDRMWVTVYLPRTEESRVAEIESLLMSRGGDDFETEIVEEEDWLAGYRDSVHPFSVGDEWWVDPHPETPTCAPPGRRRLAIPPRTAFGSGSHESTRLILCTLETTDLQGANVFDVGTGSGILALAADALGARRVLAVDVDPIAVRTAHEISRIQEWRPGVHFVTGSAGCAAAGMFQLVVCNMISADLVPLLDDMAEALATGGMLVLSGLLDSETDVVSVELSTRGLTVGPTRTMGEWASICAHRHQ